MPSYVALIHKDAKSDFGVLFPDSRTAGYASLVFEISQGNGLFSLTPGPLRPSCSIKTMPGGFNATLNAPHRLGVARQFFSSSFDALDRAKGYGCGRRELLLTYSEKDSGSADLHREDHGARNKSIDSWTLLLYQKSKLFALMDLGMRSEDHLKLSLQTREFSLLRASRSPLR